MGQLATHLNNKMQQQKSSIPLWEYNKERQRWSQNQQGTHHQNINLDKFCVTTYNVWFSDKYQPMRFKSLCDILSKSDAQVIGLQESSFFLPIIIKQIN
jgi:hypothetical protein